VHIYVYADKIKDCFSDTRIQYNWKVCIYNII